MFKKFAMDRLGSAILATAFSGLTVLRRRVSDHQFAAVSPGTVAEARVGTALEPSRRQYQYVAYMAEGRSMR